jgi:hypothetical protein
MTVHRCAVVFSCLCVCLFACLRYYLLMYLRFLLSPLDGLDNALVSLCVWNAVSKYHAPDLALVMFGACCYCVSFHLTVIYYTTFHFISCILNMTVHRCAALHSCLCVVCMLACLLVGVFAIVGIAVGRFGQRLGVFVCLECRE